MTVVSAIYVALPTFRDGVPARLLHHQTPLEARLLHDRHVTTIQSRWSMFLLGNTVEKCETTKLAVKKEDLTLGDILYDNTPSLLTYSLHDYSYFI